VGNQTRTTGYRLSMWDLWTKF